MNVDLEVSVGADSIPINSSNSANSDSNSTDSNNIDSNNSNSNSSDSNISSSNNNSNSNSNSNSDNSIGLNDLQDLVSNYQLMETIHLLWKGHHRWIFLFVIVLFLKCFVAYIDLLVSAILLRVVLYYLITSMNKSFANMQNFVERSKDSLKSTWTPADITSNIKFKVSLFGLAYAILSSLLYLMVAHYYEVNLMSRLFLISDGYSQTALIENHNNGGDSSANNNDQLQPIHHYMPDNDNMQIVFIFWIVHVTDIGAVFVGNAIKAFIWLYYLGVCKVTANRSRSRSNSLSSYDDVSGSTVGGFEGSDETPIAASRIAKAFYSADAVLCWYRSLLPVSSWLLYFSSYGSNAMVSSAYILMKILDSGIYYLNMRETIKFLQDPKNSVFGTRSLSSNTIDFESNLPSQTRELVRRRYDVASATDSTFTCSVCRTLTDSDFIIQMACCDTHACENCIYKMHYSTNKCFSCNKRGVVVNNENLGDVIKQRTHFIWF